MQMERKFLRTSLQLLAETAFLHSLPTQTCFGNLRTMKNNLLWCFRVGMLQQLCFKTDLRLRYYC